MSAGLVSWWRAEGNATDSEGTNNGVGQNGLAYASGAIGQCFAFDGQMATVLTPSSSSLNLGSAVTFSFWVQIPALPTQTEWVLSKWANNAEDKDMNIGTTGRVGFYVWPVLSYASPLESTTSLTVNKWHHVAATYDGANANIYIDGNFDATAVVSGTIANSTGPLEFGHDPSGAPGYFRGYVDEIRWYSRALSATEIATLASGCN